MDEDGIINVCERLGLSYGRPYTGTDTWGAHISIQCPLASVNHTDALDSNMGCSVQIVPDGPSGAKCWSPTCGFKGAFARLIRKAATIRPPSDELSELVLEVAGIEKLTLSSRLNRVVKKLSNTKEQAIADRALIPESAFAEFANKVPGYAIRRGLTATSCKRWNLGYDKELGYLVFPVRRVDGKLVGLVGRSVKSDPPRRHHNYAGLDKSKHLFGAQLLETGKPVVIVEGCIDAIKVDQALNGTACAVACLGEGFSQQHARTLTAYQPPAIYIFTDGDKSGRLMASKIEYCLHGRSTIKLMECPFGPPDKDGNFTKIDPDMLPPNYIRKLFLEAKPILGGLRWTEPPTIFDAKNWKDSAA